MRDAGGLQDVVSQTQGTLGGGFVPDENRITNPVAQEGAEMSGRPEQAWQRLGSLARVRPSKGSGAGGKLGRKQPVSTDGIQRTTIRHRNEDRFRLGVDRGDRGIIQRINFDSGVLPNDLRLKIS